MEFPSHPDAPGNLIIPPTPLVGREHEVAAVCGLLRRDAVRLVTLTGSGGVGKTRLAMHVSAELEPEFADGVSFIPLASLVDPGLVALSVARALGVQEGGDRPVTDRLMGVLHGKHMLLILDNFEHLLPASLFVAGLMARCPYLKVLVTSRAVLRLSGEYDYPVPPLEVPGPTEAFERIAETGAVQLFTERARAAKPTFALTTENAAAIVGICSRLEGLPLALELAAAKIRLLPPLKLLDRLAERLPILTGGPRDLPARQRTMRDTITWSHDLLAPDEQILLRRLAVFAGGFTLDAATAVAARDGLSDETVFTGVEALVEQSIVHRLEDALGEPRYGMLETVREFGIERLAASGESGGIRNAHAAYFLALAEPAEPHMLMPGQEVWLDRFEAEHANFRGALTWLDQNGQPRRLLRLAAALRWFWYLRDYFSDGRFWLERALASGDHPSSVAHARALTGLGVLMLYQGEYRRAETLLSESLRRCQQIGAQREAAIVLLAIGLATYANGDSAVAAAQTAESLALFREFEDPVFASNALENLGEIAHAQGDVRLAFTCYEEALALQRATGFTWGAIQSLWGLGNVARAEGDHERAMALYLESLGLASDHCDRRWIAYVLAGIAGVAIAEGAVERATRLFGAVEALLERIGATILPVDQATYERGVAAARAKLDDARFAAAWQTGRALTLEQAIVDAGKVGSHLASPSDSWPAPKRYGLTDREVQILRLLAEGMTDRDIAAALFISPRTVNGHTARIYAKLGVGSRAEATAWTFRNGPI